MTACLDALRAQSGPTTEVILVSQGAGPRELERMADRPVRLERPVGFARAANAGVLASRGELVGFVNDDAVVGESWLARLVEALDADPGLAGAQGTNVAFDGSVTDGSGLAWNRRWQAVQLGKGAPPPARGTAPREVFGASATAAVFRRSALDAIGSADERPFDARLYAYYEDVDLACRLRAAGWRVQSVPDARARHVGGASTGQLGVHPARLIYSNRLLVLARLLGRALAMRLPLILVRDGLDLARALEARDVARARAIVAGWARAAVWVRLYLHTGAPSVRLDEIHRLSAESWSFSTS